MASWSGDLAHAVVRAERGRQRRVLWVATAVGVLGLVILVHLMMGLAGLGVRWAEVSPARSGTSEPVFSWNQAMSVYRGRAVTVTLVHADADDAPAPPGVTGFPHPGQAYVSPALAQAVANDPSLAGRVPGDVMGLIGDDGLVTPDELRAVVGVDDPADLYSGTGWGSADIYTFGLPPVGQSDVVLAAVWGLPVVAVLAACAQAYAVRVRRQAAQLRLIGASGPQVRSFVRGYVARACLPAATLGAALGTALVLAIARSGALGLAFYPHGIIVCVLVALALLAAAIVGIGGWAVLWSRPALRSAYRTARDPGRIGGPWAPLLAGTGGLILLGIVAARWATADRHGPGPAAELAFIVGSLAFVVGTALSAGRAVRWWTARRTWRRLETQLAWRQIGHEPTPLILATLAMTALATAFTLTLAVLQVMADSTPPAAGSWWAASVGSQAAPDARALVAATGDGSVLEADGDDQATIWGTCAALQGVYGALRTGTDPCQDGRTYQAGQLLAASSGQPFSLMGTTPTVHTVDPHHANLLVPSGAALYLDARLDDPDTEQSAILTAAPTASLTLSTGSTELLVVVPAARTLTRRATLAGTGLSVAALLLAVTTAPTAIAATRRLRRIGASTPALRRLASHRLAGTMLVASLLAGLVALLVEHAYLALGSLYQIDLVTVASLLTLVVVATGAAGLVGHLAGAHPSTAPPPASDASS